MTHLGAPQAAPPHLSAPPQAVPAARPTPYSTASPAAAGSREAAHAAAVAALRAASAAQISPQWTDIRPATAPREMPADPAKPAPARPPERRRAGVRVVQIICWQLAALALVLTIGHSWIATGFVAFGALVVVAITATRIRGRWVYEWLLVSSGYLSRRHDHDLPGAAGGALLRSIAPEAQGAEDVLDGDPVFLVSRAAGVSAVLEPTPGPLPPAEAMLPPSDERDLAFAVQVIHHLGPGQQTPRAWVALQALRTIGMHQDTDLQRELGNALRRVRRRLRRDRLSTIALDERAFCGTVASLAHVTAGRARVREEWRLWHSGPIAQATFRLGGWARLSAASAPQVVRGLLAAAPHAAVTISVTTSRSVTATRTNATLRVAATNLPVLEHAAQTLARLAERYGLATERLDGRHVWGLAATLPIGVPEPR
ncbi:hypothetical protein [Amycolatopsis pigmentata]|uniref:Type VII secretion protein EccE n=1 Tax=Amycolatopsis pigmentata TaxID=450801 RepID=A0ABW5FIH7_9PSEU